GKAVMLAPTVWHGTAVSDHAFEALNFTFHRHLCRAGEPSRFLSESEQVAIAIFGKERDRVCAEQLGVANSRRGRAGAGSIRYKAGLRIIDAVAAGLECVHPDNLVTS